MRVTGELMAVTFQGSILSQYDSQNIPEPFSHLGVPRIFRCCLQAARWA